MLFLQSRFVGSVMDLASGTLPPIQFVIDGLPDERRHPTVRHQLLDPCSLIAGEPDDRRLAVQCRSTHRFILFNDIVYCAGKR